MRAALIRNLLGATIVILFSLVMPTQHSDDGDSDTLIYA